MLNIRYLYVIRFKEAAGPGLGAVSGVPAPKFVSVSVYKTA